MAGQKEVVVGPPKGEERKKRDGIAGEKGIMGEKGGRGQGKREMIKGVWLLARAAEPGWLARGAVAPNI